MREPLVLTGSEVELSNLEEDFTEGARIFKPFKPQYMDIRGHVSD